jgi:hypothetical protein
LAPEQNKDLTEFMSEEKSVKVSIGKIEVNSPMVRSNWDSIARSEIVPAINRALRSNMKLKS